MDTTSLPRLGTYTDRLQREKAAGAFLDYARSLTAGAPARLKAAVLPHTQANTGGSLQEQGVAFGEVLARQTLLGRLAASAIPTPVYARLVGVDDVGRGAFVGEGQPVPLSALSFDGPILEPAKISTIVAITRELSLSMDARARSLIEAIVTRNLRLTVDQLFLDDQAAVANVRPAGLLHNVVAAGGGSPESLPEDIAALWGAVRQGEPDRPTFIASGRGAAYLALVKDGLGAAFPGTTALGGSLIGVPLLTSRAASNKLILIDSAQLGYADDGLEVSVSDSAAVEMSDTPTPGAVSLVSSFQTDSTFLRFVHFVTWALAAALIEELEARARRSSR